MQDFRYEFAAGEDWAFRDWGNFCGRTSEGTEGVPALGTDRTTERVEAER